MIADLKVSFFLAGRMIARSSIAGTLLTVLIIALVFTNMIFMSSIISGSIQLFNQQTVDYYISHITIEPADDDRIIPNVASLLSKVNRVPGVRRASARYDLGAELEYKSSVLSMPIVAFRPEDEILVTKIHTMMKDGEFLTRTDQNEIIIGSFVAGHEDKSRDIFESLGGVQVGDSIEVRYVNGVVKNYRLKGIFQTKSYQADYMAFISWNEMEEVLGQSLNEAHQILISTQPDLPEETVRMNILSNGVREDVKTWKEATGKAIGEAIENFQIINSITLMVSLIIAIVVLFIVIMIKTIHQRKEIGILKAVGIDRNIIIGSYVLQTLAISAVGIFLGFLIIEGLTMYFSAHPIEFPDGNVSPYVEIPVLIESAVALLIASIIAGFIPAWRIVREDILTAVRGR